MEGWADSILRRGNAKIHYYKDGVSLCGKSKVDNGCWGFKKSKENLNAKYYGYCIYCIKKQL